MSDRAVIGLPDFLLEGFADCLDQASLAALADFRLDPDAQLRLDTLADQANEGTLSAAEREEYHAFIARSELFAQVQLLARSRLRLPLVS